MNQNKTNEPVEDFLEVDQPIPGQNFACLSFVSPDKLIRSKELFMTKHFLLDLLTDDNKRKYLSELPVEKMTYEKVESMYEDFRIVHEARVQGEFDEKVEYRTNIRGVKVRGVYDTLKEARVRAQVLQRRDPNFNVFVGQVGYWLPFDPANMDNIDNEYANKELNELMRHYKENANERDLFYQEDKQQRVEKAREESKQKKQQQVAEGTLKEHATTTDVEDAEEKVKELRQMVKDKEQKFSEFMRQKREEEKNVHGVNKVAKKPDDDPLGNKSGYSDPWMQRKMEGEQPLPPPSGDGKEVVFHEGDEENKTVDTGAIVKSIF